MQIYSFNTQPRNIWDNMRIRDYGDFNSHEYMARLSKSFSPIETGVLKSFEIYNTPQQYSIKQVIDAKSEWEAASDILSGRKDGSLLGFDLETLGYTNPESQSGLSLITEFGIGKRNYVNGELVSQDYTSYAIGASPEQVHELYGIIDKFKAKGYEALDQTEKSTVDRLSMIGSVGKNLHDVFQSKYDESLGTYMYTVSKLGEKTRNYDDMTNGVRLLNTLYNSGATTEAYLPKLVELFESEAQDSVIYGANAKFDYGMLEKQTGRSFDEYLNRTVDITNGIRIGAASESSSVLSYLVEKTGRVPLHTERAASMDNLPEIFGLNIKQLHTAGKDVFNEGEVLAFKNFAKTDDGYTSFVDAVVNATNSDSNIYKTRVVDLDNSVFYFNRGGMDISKSDYATIKGEVIPQSYSMSNDFWRVDTNATGTYKLQMPNEDAPIERFIAVYQNAADPDVVIRKEYDSAERFFDELRRNTNQVPNGDISAKQLRDQHKLALLDRGRREFIRGINPGDVRTNNTQDEYGVQKLLKNKEKLKLIEPELNGQYKINDKLLQIVEANKEKLDLHSPYQVQSFAGSVERLHYESDMINYISSQIDTAYNKPLDNLSKTILFEQVYSDIQKRTFEELGYEHVETPTYNISDVFGIDIDTGDGIKRINTQTVESARIDIDRIFKDKTKEQAMSMIDDLAQRKIISEDVHAKLISSADLNFKPNEGIYNFTVDAATELSKITDIFKQEYAKNDKVIQEFISVKDKDISPEYEGKYFDRDNLIAIQNKNLHSISTEQSAIGRGLVLDKNTGRIRHLGALFKGDKNFKAMIDDSTDKAIANTQVLYTGESEAKLARGLSQSLNLQTESQSKILEEMFVNKPYSLSRKENGLQHFVISPRQGTNDSAFVIVTNDKHINTVQNILMKQQDAIEEALSDGNINSFQKLSKMFDNDAAIIELHHVNTTTINDSFSNGVMELLNTTRDAKETSRNIALTSISQGKIEKFVTPTIETWIGKDKVIRTKISDNVEDMLSAYRMKFDDFLSKINDDDFAGATMSIRRAQNNVLTKLSTPSSYRGRKIGNTIKRIPDFHAADFMNAYEMDIKGVLDLFNIMATENNDSSNAVQKILERFNLEHGITSGDILKNAINPGRKQGYETIAKSAQFAEYFAQNLFLGEGSNNILDAMRNVAKENSSRYDKSVLDVLDNLKNVASEINQILPDSATKHKDLRYMISFVMPGEFSNLQGLFSTMRPTYYQQNRPMFFSEEDFEELKNFKTAFQTLGKEVSGDGFLSDKYTRLKQASYSDLEYKIRELNPDKLKGITTRFKQVSDADLHHIYNSLSGDKKVIKEIAANVRESVHSDVKEDSIQKAIEYISADMSNVYEGKWYVDPLFSQTVLFTDKDAKRISPFDIESIDIKATSELLKDGKHIKTGDVIGISSNHKKIYYNGPDFTMSKEIKDELLSYGSTYIIPESGTINDIKLMIGSEKGTAHTINIEDFMNYTGIGKESKAIQTAHEIFQRMFGANVVGNISASKHNNNYAAWSEWNIIENRFDAAGRLSKLEELTKGIPEFEDWKIKIKGGKDAVLVMDTSHSQSIVQAIRKLEERLKTDVQKRKPDDALYKLYSDILSDIEYGRKNNVIYGMVQRVHMNEHLSNMFKMDKRLEQGIRLRNQDFHEIGVRSADDKYLDAFKEIATSEDVGMARTKLLNSDLFQAYSDAKSVKAVDNVRRYNQAAKGRQKDMAGVFQARDFLLTGKKPGNAVTITIDNLKDSKGRRIIPKNATVEDLRNFIFDVDGKPSEFLQRLADAQNVKLDKDSYSIYFDFGQSVKINLGKNHSTEISGVVLPRLNISTTTSGADEYFVDSQRNVTSLMNSILDYVDNEPGHKDLKNVIENYGSKLIKNTQLLDSDSDLYKAVGRWAMPNSGEFLSQDETSALVDEMFTNGLYDKYLQQEAIRKEFINHNYSNLNKYNELGKEIKDGLSEIAKTIEDVDKELPEFTATKAMQKFSHLSSIIEIDGKQTYNNAVAIGEEGFKELGFDFGKAGMDLLSAQQNGKTKLIPGMADGRFVISQKEINTIVNKINKLKIGEKIDANDKDIIGTLNDLLIKKHGLDPDTAITIKNVNKAITDKEAKSIYKIFEDISKRYVTEIGLFGEHVRYPTFVGQPAVNVKLDKTITGRQMRFLNPLFSLYTNVDFDGDKTFLSLLLNGNSVGTFDNKALSNLYESWKQGMSNNRTLVADMIRKGDAFKRDLLTDYDYGYANMLKSFKENDFWNAVNEFVDISMPQFSNLSNAEKEANEGLMMAAMHSQQMTNAWEKSGINTLTDREVILASMIPNIRKLNIGMFSTPNFNLRDVLIDVRNNKAYTKETREEIADILSDMSNMKIESHGLTGITEQKGIDVKHVIDASHVATTPKWSIGMNQLFKREGTQKDKIQGLTNLVEASKSILFKDYMDTKGNLIDTQQIVEDIINHTRQEFKAIGDDDFTQAKRWLRGVYDVSNIQGTDVMFTSALKKSSPFNFIVNDIINDTDTHTYGTLISSVDSILENAHNSVDFKYQDTGYHVYIKPGDMTGSPDRMYIPEMHGDFIDFKEIDDAGNVINKVSNQYAGTIRQANRTADEFFGNSANTVPELLTIHDVTEQNANYKGAINTAKRKKTLNTINTILGKNGLTEYKEFLGLDAYRQKVYGEAQYRNVTQLFGTTVQEAEQQLQKVKELELAYKYYNSGKKTEGIKPLISKLNQDIVNHPEKYANTTFSDALNQTILKATGNDSVKFKDAIAMQAKFGNIIDTYDSAISSLNNGLYDIISEEKKLGESFDKLQDFHTKVIKDVDEAKDLAEGISTRISKQQSIINETLGKLKKENKSVITKAQDTVYDLFKNDQQMSEFFKFSERSIDTKVGFGSYLGVSFGNLSTKDIDNVLSEAKQILDTKSATGKYATAVIQTESALKYFKSHNKNIMQGKPILPRNFKASVNVEKVVSENQDLLDEFVLKARDLDDKVLSKLEANARKNTTKKKILDSEAFSGVKDLAKKYITPKNVGIAVAGMAALGIANNLLHKQRNQSPLAPQQTGPTSPSIAGNNPSVEMPQQAPASKGPLQKRVVYHDNPSGLNFKISAKTKHNMDARQTASLVNNMGGGQVNYSVSQDTSGVSDNWLANKFAELA